MSVHYGPSAYTRNGSSAALAAPSALAIKRANPQAQSGVYWIQVSPTVGAVQLYCEMSMAEGGWTLIGKSGPGLWSNPTGWLKSSVSPANLQSITVEATNAYSCIDARYLAASARQVCISSPDRTKWVYVDMHSQTTVDTIFNHSAGQTAIAADAAAYSELKTAYAWNGNTTASYVNRYMIMAVNGHGGSTPAWTLNTAGNTNVNEYAMAVACASNTTFNGFSAATTHNGMDAPFDDTWPNASYNSGMFKGHIWVR